MKFQYQQSPFPHMEPILNNKKGNECMNPQASNILSLIPRTIKNFEQNLGDLVKSLDEISVELKKNNEVQERIAKAAEAQAKAQEEQTELAKQMVGRMMNPFGCMGGDDGEDDGENYYGLMCHFPSK